MDTKRLQIALLFIIAFLSNVIAIVIELFGMMGELYSAAHQEFNSLGGRLKSVFYRDSWEEFIMLRLLVS
jgi:hypothetical protein